MTLPLPVVSGPRRWRELVALLLVVVLAGSGCMSRVEVTEDQTAQEEWFVGFDRSDEISRQHVESVLSRAGVRPTASLHMGRTLGFSGADADAARRALMADESWPEIKERMESLVGMEERLRRAPPVLKDVGVAEALARLDERKSPAAEALRVVPGDVPGLEKRSVLALDHVLPLQVVWMAVLDRRYLGPDGERHQGCEFAFEVRARDGSYGMHAYGQVMSDGTDWEVRFAGGGAHAEKEWPKQGR